MFNLKKYSENQRPYSKLLEDSNSEDGLNTDNNDKNFNKQLEEDRKNDDNLSITEKQLDDKRVDKEDAMITEKQLDKGASLSKRGTESDIITDYGNIAEKNRKKSENEDKPLMGEKPFSNKFVGDELVGPASKIVGNTQKSQLLSNYDNRKDFNDANKSISSKKVAEASIKNLDAAIYYIYRFAAEENREIKESERKLIDRINEEKEKILTAAIFPTEGEAGQIEVPSNTELAQEEQLRKLDEIDENISEDSPVMDVVIPKFGEDNLDNIPSVGHVDELVPPPKNKNNKDHNIEVEEI